MAKVDWEKRRKNFRILLAVRGTNATEFALSIGLSPNTLSKFASGATQTLSQRSLDSVIEGLGLTSASDLDSDNPVSDPKMELRKIIDGLPSTVLPTLLQELKVRFADQLPD